MAFDELAQQNRHRPQDPSRQAVHQRHRVPVSVIVGSIAEGNTLERIIDSWPQLNAEDITAALRFAAALAAEATVFPADSAAE